MRRLLLAAAAVIALAGPAQAQTMNGFDQMEMGFQASTCSGAYRASRTRFPATATDVVPMYHRTSKIATEIFSTMPIYESYEEWTEAMTKAEDVAYQEMMKASPMVVGLATDLCNFAFKVHQ